VAHVAAVQALMTAEGGVQEYGAAARDGESPLVALFYQPVGDQLGALCMNRLGSQAAIEDATAKALIFTVGAVDVVNG
jgi:hypothetical protein